MTSPYRMSVAITSSLPSPCMSMSRTFETAELVGALAGFIPRFTNDIGLAGGQTSGARSFSGACRS